MPIDLDINRSVVRFSAIDNILLPSSVQYNYLFPKFEMFGATFSCLIGFFVLNLKPQELEVHVL